MADLTTTVSAEAPSGLPPDQSEEEQPLGVPDEAAAPQEPDRGAEAMPGIPDEGEPPAAG